MNLRVGSLTICLAAALPAAPAMADTLPAGTYHCIVGYSTMLTLGNITISGGSYTFHPQGDGAATSGTYTMSGTGIRWSGDIGAVKNSMIAASGRDLMPNVFWLKYTLTPGRAPMTVSCKR